MRQKRVHLYWGFDGVFKARNRACRNRSAIADQYLLVKGAPLPTFEITQEISKVTCKLCLKKFGRYQ